MDAHELTKGEGRTKVNLFAYYLGDNLVACIYNENAHIGAVAVGEYDHRKQRTSCSVITRLGHKDNAVAQDAAYLISKHTKKPVCVIAGIHLDCIIDEEINKILENATSLVEEFVSQGGTKEP